MFLSWHTTHLKGNSESSTRLVDTPSVESGTKTVMIHTINVDVIVITGLVWLFTTDPAQVANLDRVWHGQTLLTVLSVNI